MLSWIWKEWVIVIYIICWFAIIQDKFCRLESQISETTTDNLRLFDEHLAHALSSLRQQGYLDKLLASGGSPQEILSLSSCHPSGMVPRFSHLSLSSPLPPSLLASLSFSFHSLRLILFLFFCLCLAFAIFLNSNLERAWKHHCSLVKIARG